MPASEIQPTVTRQLTPRYIAILMGAAIAILVVGSALRPRQPIPGAASPPTQSEMRRLQRLAERQSLESMTQHFAGIASDVEDGIVLVGQGSGSAIVWTPELVVGAGQGQAGDDSTTVVAVNGESLLATRVVSGPDLPLAAFQVSRPLVPVFRRRSDAPGLAPGQWLVAVWRRQGGQDFAPGHHVETRNTLCGGLVVREILSSFELTAPMAGGGLFDLDEALVGVVLPCDGRYTVLTPESVSLGLDQGQTAGGRLWARYGIRVVPLDETTRKHLRADSGVLVSQVWEGFPGELGGLHPGDVIVTVDGNDVTSPDGLQRLLAPTEHGEALIGVWRARRSRELRLISHPDRMPGSGSGLVLAKPTPGFLIGPISAGSPAAQAGIREGDQLLRVDFATPRSPAEAVRALSPKGQPVYVEILRGGQHIGVLVG